MKSAIIIGSDGQDGRLLWDLLKEKGYTIIGIDIGSIYSTNSQWNSKVDISSQKHVFDLIKKVKPDQVYYLAAYHHSAEDDLGDLYHLIQTSYMVNVNAYLTFLEGIRRFSPKTRIFYAASSHIFGEPTVPIQDETTKFNPKSIYAITKLDGLLLSRHYRETFSTFASVGIMYNHESPFRQDNFVSKKIVTSAVEIKANLKNELVLGDMNAQIDWGYAGDYVFAMYRILSHRSPDDFIVASGNTVKLRDFIDIVFNYLELDWKKYVKEDPTLLKRKAAYTLCGNSKKLTDETNWKPKVGLKELAYLMVDDELRKNG